MSALLQPEFWWKFIHAVNLLIPNVWLVQKPSRADHVNKSKVSCTTTYIKHTPTHTHTHTHTKCPRLCNNWIKAEYIHKIQLPFYQKKQTTTTQNNQNLWNNSVFLFAENGTRRYLSISFSFLEYWHWNIYSMIK